MISSFSLSPPGVNIDAEQSAAYDAFSRTNQSLQGLAVLFGPVRSCSVPGSDVPRADALVVQE